MKKQWQFLILGIVVACLVLYAMTWKSSDSGIPTATPRSVVFGSTPASSQSSKSVAEIPGLHPHDVTPNLTQRDFTCSSWEKSGQYYTWTCKRTGTQYEFLVDIWGPTLSTVSLVEATALVYSTSYDDLATEFLGFVATLPYDNSTPQAARDWVEKTVPTIKTTGDIRKKTFGGVKYRLYGKPTARVLEMGSLR